jgi:hypothetical protein
MKLVGKFFAAIALAANVGTTLLADDDGEGRRIELPVPIGHDVKGLRLPIRNDQGKVEMLFDMESARRLDEQNIEMHTVTIQMFNQQTFKPDTEVITTKEPVRITRDDFVLTAESGEFNSKTRQGAVYGNIHLVIYNRNEFQTKSPSEGQQQLSK